MIFNVVYADNKYHGKGLQSLLLYDTFAISYYSILGLVDQMITREIDYAFRAMLYLAQHDGEIVSTTILAEEMGIPYRFLRRILLRLTATRLVASVRGKLGGLRLVADPAAVSLLDIVAAVDPHAVTLNLCLADPAACTRTNTCVVHEELVDVQQLLHDRLRQISLATLADRARTRNA